MNRSLSTWQHLLQGHHASTFGQGKRWCFTLNNPEDGDLAIVKLVHGIKEIVIAKEVGEEEKTPHWQGAVVFTKKKRFAALKKLGPWSTRCHWELAKSWDEAWNYCLKGGDIAHCIMSERSQGKRKDLQDIKEIIEDYGGHSWEQCFLLLPPAVAGCMRWARELFNATRARPDFKLDNLRNWQAELERELTGDADDRKIIWYVDLIGGSGKTVFTKHMYSQYFGQVFLGRGKQADIAYAYNYEPIIIIDIERSYEQFTPYGLVEQLKNGTLFSGKYTSVLKFRAKPPHVVVFSNFEPERSKLSADHWDVRRLGGYAAVAARAAARGRGGDVGVEDA